MADRDGFFVRTWNRLFGRAEMEPPPSHRSEAYDPPPDTDPIVVAASGDVFDLQVIPHFRWTSTALSFEELVRRAGLHHENARNTVMRHIWHRARGLDPTRPSEAEDALNNIDAIRDGWCYGSGAEAVACTPTLRVLLDPRLREQRLPFEMNRLRAEEVYCSTEKWLSVIKDLEGLSVIGRDERQFLVPFMATLVDENFAKATGALASHRRQRSTDLAKVLAQASQDHEQLGLFEFANAYDKALRAFCRQMGLSPFSWAIAEFGGVEQRVEENE